MKSNPRIEVAALTVHYNDVVAVDGIDFTVQPGELVTRLGPSGGGKTTTLRAIAGLEDPSGGTIRLGGETVSAAAQKRNGPAEKRGLSMVFQSYAIWPHLSVFDTVAYPLSVRKIAKAEIATRVEAHPEIGVVS